MKPWLNAWRKLHQKVCIALGRVKATGPRSRTKHLQPPNAVALADGGVAGAVLGDGGVHGDEFTVGARLQEKLAISTDGVSVRCF